MRIRGIEARKRVARWVLAGLLAAVGSSAGVASAQAPASPEPGVWEGHKLRFNYLGFDTTYSCTGMQHHIEEVLRAMEAAPGFKVTPGGCVEGFDRPTKLIYMQLEFQSLKPLDAAAAPAGAAASTASVPGVWRHVEFRPRQPFDFGGGDCELMDELRIKVMALFATRDFKSSLSCVPYQDSSHFWSLSFEVFAAH
jgi:hypothetical protein